jgi:hypothetical protein
VRLNRSCCQLLNAQIDDETLGGGERWAFVGIALMPWDRAMADCLKKQVCEEEGARCTALCS